MDAVFDVNVLVDALPRGASYEDLKSSPLYQLFRIIVEAGLDAGVRVHSCAHIRTTAARMIVRKCGWSPAMAEKFLVETHDAMVNSTRGRMVETKMTAREAAGIAFRVNLEDDEYHDDPQVFMAAEVSGATVIVTSDRGFGNLTATEVEAWSPAEFRDEIVARIRRRIAERKSATIAA